MIFGLSRSQKSLEDIERMIFGLSEIQKSLEDIERMIFGLSGIVFGLSLMDCLWNVCGLLGMDFSMSLIGFPQPFVCVGRSRKPWPLERWKSSTGSYSLYIHWVFYLVFFQLAALRDVAKAAIQLQEIQVQL